MRTSENGKFWTEKNIITKTKTTNLIIADYTQRAAEN